VPGDLRSDRGAGCAQMLAAGQMFERSRVGRCISGQSSPAEGAAVSATDKAKDKVDAAKGKIKKDTGEAIDDPYLEGEGKAEEVEGNLKQAGEKVKDAFKK
jgi:uncharacterized protein YjbJ (UPF0337 family)